MFDKRKNLDCIAADTVGEYYRASDTKSEVDTVIDMPSFVQNFVDCMYFGGDLGKNSDFVGSRCIDKDRRRFDTVGDGEYYRALNERRVDCSALD